MYMKWIDLQSYHFDYDKQNYSKREGPGHADYQIISLARAMKAYFNIQYKSENIFHRNLTGSIIIRAQNSRMCKILSKIRKYMEKNIKLIRQIVIFNFCLWLLIICIY